MRPAATSSRTCSAVKWGSRSATRVISGFVDQVTLVLENLKVHKAGKVKKIITIGEYDLDVVIDRVSGRLRTGEPDIRFGGNQVSIALPIEIASGSGDATIHFVWDGKNISGALDASGRSA